MVLKKWRKRQIQRQMYMIRRVRLHMVAASGILKSRMLQYTCMSIYLFPLLAYQHCHASLDSSWHSFTKMGSLLQVRGRWLVVSYGGLCPQAEVIFFAYQHVPLVSINRLDSRYTMTYAYIPSHYPPSFPSLRCQCSEVYYEI